MLGPSKARDLDRPIVVSLDQLVPTDHFYRHLERELDLSFVRDWVRERYAPNGRPSIDPVVFFKLELALFFEGLRSARQLMRVAADHLSIRWYAGYNLDEPLPDHSSLTRIRQRLGVDVFRRFFEHVVDLCNDAGLIWGKELLVDATKVRANASMDSFVPRLAEVVDDHLIELFGDQGGTAEPVSVTTEEVAPPLLHPKSIAETHEEQPTAERRWDVLKECRLDPDRPLSPGYQRLSSRKISRTDQAATPMSVRYGGTALGYQDHYLVDGGKARIIPGTRLRVSLITTGNVMENQPFRDQLRRTVFRYQLRPTRVIADTTYGTVENLLALEEDGITPFIPLPEWEKSSPFYRADRFRYDVERDVYVCPQGTLLTLRWTDQVGKRKQYRAVPAVCKVCPLHEQCTANRRGRVIYRPFHAELLERVKAHHHRPAFQKAMRKRSVWVEPLFAEAKQWHGLTQFRLRGLHNVNMQGLLVASGQNLKRYLAARGWGRRSGPTGSLGFPAQTLCPLPVSIG